MKYKFLRNLYHTAKPPSTPFIVFSTSMLFIYLCTISIKRIIHNLICYDALCMRNNVQCTLYMIVLQMNVTSAYYFV